MYSESSLQVVISAPYYCPVIHAHCIADARFVSARDVIHDTIAEFNVDSKARPSSRPICDVAARTRQLLSIYSSIVSQMSINK